jgi:uncharacterized membrane protein YedE/YeeE
MLAWLQEGLGDSGTAVLAGFAIGAAFGAFAQASRFCLRAATLSFWRGQLEAPVAVWVVAFSVALLATQGLMVQGVLDPQGIRALNAASSLSGALLGGAMFGVGMVMTRGCASRLLVLSANGNLRALVSGLIFAVTAQASLRGVLAPAREAAAGFATIGPGTGLDVLSATGTTHASGLVFGFACLAVGLGFAWRTRIALATLAAAAGVGLMVAVAWAATAYLAASSFDPQPVKSLSFTGPSANVLMAFLTGAHVDFDLGLVPGVVAGSFLSAYTRRELKLEGFHDGVGMSRYITGAGLMGFGGMLAGGCAIGAGVSGAAVFATTAWATLLSMWIAAGLADVVLDRRGGSS